LAACCIGGVAAVFDLEQEAVLLGHLLGDGLVDVGVHRGKPTIWLSSEISLNGLSPSATAKSRTTIGGLRCRP
jgi:hypothetical protein